MTRDQIVKWVEEAGVIPPGWGATENQWCSLERFAALVAASCRRRKAWDAKYWTAYEHDVAAAEREACAKVVEDMAGPIEIYNPKYRRDLKFAAAIRARGVGMTQDEKDVLQNALDEAMVEIRGRNS